MPDGNEYLDDPYCRPKDRPFPYEPPPRRRSRKTEYVRPGEVPFGVDGLLPPRLLWNATPTTAETEATEQAAADVLLDRALDVAAGSGPPLPPAVPDPGDTPADRLRREAAALTAAATADLDARAAAARTRAEFAQKRTARLLSILQSLNGMWLGGVPRLEYGAGDASSRLGRHTGQIHVESRVSAWDREGVSQTGCRILVRLRCPNAITVSLIEWATGWVNPTGNHTRVPYHTDGWVIDDYATAMADKPPMLTGQKPRLEGAAVELTLDLLRKFVIPDPTPAAPAAPPEPVGTRAGLDL